jgi:putative restriction endonuclease
VVTYAAAVRGFVAPTDYGWYRFLQARPELREVNFWQPSEGRFSAVQSGELFFFKLKSPYNAIGGFGIFTRHDVLPVWQAWDVFGPANGVASPDELVERLGRLTASRRERFSIDAWIGCLAINEPLFFPPDEWVEVPTDWRRQIVSGKGYDLSRCEGRLLYEPCVARARELTPGAAVEGRYGLERLTRPRLGQASFRLAVRDAYGKRCAVTGERSLPVVEAGHIKPYAQGGEHAVWNGLFVRRDIHRLFDLGYVSVRPDLGFTVSPALRDEWENGRAYYILDGCSLHAPERPADRPSSELLDWHYSEVFRRS